MNRPARLRRSNAEYRWTRDKILVFLKALSLGASVAEAGRHVGMSRQSAYRLRARLGAAFGDVWDEGLRRGMAVRAGANGRIDAQGDTRGLQGDTLRAQGDTGIAR